MFFNDSLVGEGRGADILPGTPLRMPQVAEYDSFVKIIMQVRVYIFIPSNGVYVFYCLRIHTCIVVLF